MYEEHEIPQTVTMTFESGITNTKTLESDEPAILAIYDSDQNQIPFDPYGDGKVGYCISIRRQGEAANTTYFNVTDYELHE